MDRFRTAVRCVALATILAAACKAPGPTPISDADKAAMKQVADRGLVTFKSATPDWPAFVAAMYAEDATVLPPNGAAARGRDAITGVVRAFPPIAEYTQVSQRLEGSGNMAYEIASYSLRLAPPGAPAVVDTGKLVWVWRKGADGSWKILVEIWNSDRPEAGAAAPPAQARAPTRRK
jgi:ketosteroid isomerase-like protein